MVLSNQSDLPAFFLFLASHRIGFRKSCEMALAFERKKIVAYDKLELARPRLVIFRDLVAPESQLAKSEKRI
jgi:hypothetical protein